VASVLARLLVGVVPVVAFLLVLIYLDSYKLVRLRAVLLAIVAGGVAAGVAYGINVATATRLSQSLAGHARYVAPVIEETVKALILFALVRGRRVGFLVDAAIFGFAIGCGFAFVENLYYLQLLQRSAFGVWLLRGLGTAIMHGGTTAIFGILAKTLVDRGRERWAIAAGLLPAIAIHSFFNHFFLSPVVSSLAMLVALPPLFVVVFARSERALRSWLGLGFDADAELLGLIHSGQFSQSKVGRYLRQLRERFSGPVVADMLCYLRLHLELSLRAKGELMLREAGFRPRPEPELRAKLDEMRFLERSIGRTGRLALYPFLDTSGRAGWQLKILE